MNQKKKDFDLASILAKFSLNNGDYCDFQTDIQGWEIDQKKSGYDQDDEKSGVVLTVKGGYGGPRNPKEKKSKNFVWMVQEN